MLLTFAATLLVPLLTWFSNNEEPYNRNGLDALPSSLQLELRHLHAVDPSSAHVIFSDVSQDAIKTLSYMNSNDPSTSTKPSYSIRPRRTKTYRPSSFAAHAQARMRSLHFGESEKLDWEEEEIESPDVESRETLLELAKMTNNAYVDPEDPAWYDLNGRWNIVSPILLSVMYSMNPHTRLSFSAESPCRSVGSRSRMDSVDTSLRHLITRPSLSLSRVHPQAFLVVAGQRQGKTS